MRNNEKSIDRRNFLKSTAKGAISTSLAIEGSTIVPTSVL